MAEDDCDCHLNHMVRPRAAIESVPASVARIPLMWLIANHPNDWPFPAQLAPGDFALTTNGQIYTYNGIRWRLLVPSSPDDDEGTVTNVRVTSAEPRKLEVQYEV